MYVIILKTIYNDIAIKIAKLYMHDAIKRNQNSKGRREKLKNKQNKGRKNKQ